MQSWPNIAHLMKTAKYVYLQHPVAKKNQIGHPIGEDNQ